MEKDPSNDLPEGTTTPKKNILKKICEFIKEYWKIFTPCALAYGFIQLFYYTSTHNIPFPVTLSNLPSLLVILTSTVLLVIAFFLTIILFPAIVHNKIFKDVYSDRKIDSCGNIKKFFNVSGFTIVLYIILIYADILLTDLKIFEWGLFVLTAFVILIPWIYIWRSKKKHYGFFIGIFNIFIIIWTTLIILLIANELPKIDIPKELHGLVYLFLIILFFIFIYSITFPQKRELKPEDKTAFVVLLVILFFFFPINQYMLKKALYALKLGGGFEAVYYFNENNKESFPKEICYEKIHTYTKPVLVFWELDNKIHLKSKDNPSKKMYEIDATKISYKELPDPKEKNKGAPLD